MKRLLLGSLLSCMVVGQMFSSDRREGFGAYSKEIDEAVREASRSHWEREGIKSGLRVTGIAGVSGAFAGGLFGVGAHRLSTARTRAAFAPRIPLVRGCAAGTVLGFLTARIGISHLENRLDAVGFERRVLSAPQFHTSGAFEKAVSTNKMIDTAKTASSMGFVASSLAFLRMLFRK